MLRRSFLVGGAALTASAVGGLPAAAAGRWTRLGTRHVNWALDHDTIPVGMLRAPFDHLYFRVTGNALYMIDLDVTYSNGAPDHIPVRSVIPQGGQSRVIDLRGGDRFIRRVEFTYSRPPNGRGVAVVELWGQR